MTTVRINPAELAGLAAGLQRHGDDLRRVGGGLGTGLPAMPIDLLARTTGELVLATGTLHQADHVLDGIADELRKRAFLALLADASSLIALFLGPFGVGRQGSKSDPRWDFLLKVRGKRTWDPTKRAVGGYRFNRRLLNQVFEEGARRTGNLQDVDDWNKQKEARKREIFSGVTFLDMELLKADIARREGHLDFDGKHGQISGEIAAAHAASSLKLGFDRHGLNADLSASASAVLAAGRVGYKRGPLEVGGEVAILARADAQAKASFGRGVVDAHAGVKGFVGAEANARGGVGAGGVKAKGTAGVTAGLGGQLGGDVHASMDKVRVKADIGASLGVGVHLSVDVEVKPKEIVHNIGHAADAAGHAAGHAAHEASHAVSSVTKHIPHPHFPW